MEKKICFKCGKEKPVSEYYKHKGMADGFLNKCKVCAKSDTQSRYYENIEDSVFKQKEQKRGREKYRRLYRYSSKANRKSNIRYNEKFPEKYLAKNASGKLKAPFEGAEKHHWSYNKEHYKDVIWLTKQQHKKGHRFIIYDQERKMYRRYDNNELLDTKVSHDIFIRWCIQTKED